jgi:flagellar biogenesis protein FliO
MLSAKLAIFLMVIFALMTLFFFIIRRVKGGKFSKGKPSVMKNLATLHLAPKRSLALVEVCGHWLLVGVGSENVSLISKIDKPCDGSQYEGILPQEGSIFDSFLLKAGLKHRAPEGGSSRNE